MIYFLYWLGRARVYPRLPAPCHKFADAGCQLGDVRGHWGLWSPRLVSRVTCHVSRDGDPAWSHPSAQWLRLDRKVDRLEGRVMDSDNVSSHPF